MLLVTFVCCVDNSVSFVKEKHITNKKLLFLDQHYNEACFFIGLGPNVHRQNFINQLRTIASEDTENHLYLFSTYQSFSDAAINISRNLCHDATNLEKQGMFV